MILSIGGLEEVVKYVTLAWMRLLLDVGLNAIGICLCFSFLWNKCFVPHPSFCKAVCVTYKVCLFEKMQANYSERT